MSWDKLSLTIFSGQGDEDAKYLLGETFPALAVPLSLASGEQLRAGCALDGQGRFFLVIIR